MERLWRVVGKSEGADGAGQKSRVPIFDRHLVELAAFICTPEEIVSLSVEYAPQVPDKNVVPDTAVIE